MWHGYSWKDEWLNQSARKESWTQPACSSAAIFDLRNTADQIPPALFEALIHYYRICYLSHNQADQTQVRGRNAHHSLFCNIISEQQRGVYSYIFLRPPFSQRCDFLLGCNCVGWRMYMVWHYKGSIRQRVLYRMQNMLRTTLPSVDTKKSTAVHFLNCC